MLLQTPHPHTPSRPPFRPPYPRAIRARRGVGPAWLVAGALLVSALEYAPAAWAEHHPVLTHPVAADAGVVSEASTVIDAPPARVAAVAGDPAHFVELFPAIEVRVLRSQGASLLISVVRKEPWPVGVISWEETVSRYQEDDGKTLVQVIDREAQPGTSTFFRQMKAVLRVSPDPTDPQRSLVKYRVGFEISRWAPAWMLRRSNAIAMTATLERLRQIAER